MNGFWRRLPVRLHGVLGGGLFLAFFVSLLLPKRPWWLPWLFLSGAILNAIVATPARMRQEKRDAHEFRDEIRGVLVEIPFPESLPRVLSVWAESTPRGAHGFAYETTVGRKMRVLSVEDRDAHWSDYAEAEIHDHFIAAVAEGVDATWKFEIPIGRRSRIPLGERRPKPRTAFGRFEAPERVREVIGTPDVGVLALDGFIACITPLRVSASPTPKLARECIELVATLERVIEALPNEDDMGSSQLPT
jgi:hypothetical protein